ncbi:putative serine/threonine-protein kinase-like protein CCR3 [Cucurbita moschata]|uniref:non-specific serine/threonine protein kinase n=1 Tax=Cucurbita moschata TaxID=3662 RepID=A0A6J1FUM0_CUCMO|nr:putative serine/threonine-protein kinase-like protein CCR3 [Cucurbita moschata]
MTRLPLLTAAIPVISFIAFVFPLLPATLALGSASTLAVSYGSTTVCGIVAEQPTQRILCFRRGQTIFIDPNISFSVVSAGRDTFCGIRAGGYTLLCWDFDQNTAAFSRRRLYFNSTVLLENLAVGDDQICATVVGAGNATCWRDGNNVRVGFSSLQFDSISSGFGFSCGILKGNQSVRCWGRNSSIAALIENGFRNISMSIIVAGGFHACGLNISGGLVCRGNNDFGQLDFPSNSSRGFSELALGERHSCGILLSNRSVVCWGSSDFSVDSIRQTSFELISSGSDFVCGLTTSNFSVLCWGPGWSNDSSGLFSLSLPKILPGPCVQSSCRDCGVYPLSQTLCSDSGNVCNRCLVTVSPPFSPIPPSPPPMVMIPSPPPAALRKGLLAFAIVGSVGAVAGICTVVYCLWTGVCFGHKKIHNSVQPTITRAASSNGGTTTSNTNNSPPSRSSTIRRQGSRIMRRQRSGTSSKHADRAEEFTLAELALATNDFSHENKIGEGSFGIVYRGKLSDGREVAIKRGETGPKTKKFQEKESAFDSELAFLSRLHHKHLVRLVGYCEEKDERLLVYEYMKNGALYNHLHDKTNSEKGSSVVNSWKMRIKIALDAARGIEYLHNYAVPPIIHRDIKSSNILLDSNWTARVSDFGLSLMSPGSDLDYRPTKAAGTVGYIDPEYYGLNVLTAKSDVYGLGVVLLELLTGKRAIFKDDERGGTLVSVVDFAVPAITIGELGKILDPRVGPPQMNEAEAVELVAYTAMHCVRLEGKDRPTMIDIVVNLERALNLCDDSHGNSSSGGISIVSE